jgi:hypothetical protein
MTEGPWEGLRVATNRSERMSGEKKPTTRKPATKFAHLRKKQRKQHAGNVGRACKQQQHRPKP